MCHCYCWQVSTPVIQKIMTVASTGHMLTGKEVASIQPPVMLIWGK
jgi:hypothetical protein